MEWELSVPVWRIARSSNLRAGTHVARYRFDGGAHRIESRCVDEVLTQGEVWVMSDVESEAVVTGVREPRVEAHDLRPRRGRQKHRDVDCD